MNPFYTRKMFVRAALTLLAMCCFSWTFADDITAEQALQLAQTFVNGQNNGPGGRRNSPGTTPQLTQEKQVSGLYVFNVSNDGGFIIVSNDDRTQPILGFSESGRLNPDNMPSNMRAWLQGYADEIAWLQKHGAKLSGKRNAPRRKDIQKYLDIPPMVTTRWNQDAPYNNLCPTYYGGSRSATGCVATAMAQVMKYHEWPQAATTSIPGYTTDSYNLTLSALPAFTFDWANMLDTYSGNSTSAQKTAVAKLMQYCGYSVQMDYGPSSGAYTDAVATALKQYFDYKNTTQFVTRNQFTYADWTNLIYHELSQQRPVVYGGMSTGGGHEFVCDGFKYENGTGFFHINWGWGGTSDEYFVLSALDPDEQGIGGSSSTDGFHFGQDAVIGIQPSTGTGTIADITPNEINLTLVDAYANPSTILLGQTADLVVKVTNNSQDPYEGDIMLYEETGTFDDEILSHVFRIEPGETKECVFAFTPTKLGSYSFRPMRNDFYYFESPAVHYVTLDVVEEIAELPEGLTVCDGATTSQKVPAYIYYFDDYTRSQFVIPADQLEEMEGGTIDKISFYTSYGYTLTTDSPVDVYMKEVNYTTINAFESKSNATMVYQGKLKNAKLSSNKGLMTITLSNPFTYEGGNLLIGIENTTDAGYTNVYFYGVIAPGVSVAGAHSGSLNSVNPEQQDFLPKTTFSYTPGETTGVPKPRYVTVNYTGGLSAEVSWTGEADSFDIDVNGNVTEQVSNPYTITGLALATTYTVKVRAHIGSDVSDWTRPVSFTTAAEYQVPADVAANGITATSADITWTGNDEATSYNLRYTEGAATDFFEDFENGLDGWTVLRKGGGTSDTDWHIVDPATSFSYNSYSAHSGNYVAMSRSYSNGAYNVDNWLISPQVDLGNSMSFWMMGNPSFPEYYEVLVSTTTTNINAFTKVFESDVATSSWSEVTVDLSAFAGQQGYVAFRNKDYDAYYLLIDDITIAAPSIDFEWTTVNDVTSPYVLEGLESGTTYTVEVQAVYEGGSSAWTSARFNTLALDAAPVNLMAADVTATAATLSWEGMQDSYNVRYRTSAVPDASEPATIILEAHDVWGDGSGYQLLLDADATAYGTLWNAQHIIFVDGSQYTGGNLSASYYNEFESKIPKDADGSLSTTHVVVDGTVTIRIPAGTYDYVILNPTPGDKFFIAADKGEVGGAEDNFVFEPGKTYHFTMAKFDSGDGATLEITSEWSDWTEVKDIADTSYELTSLTPGSYYEWQVQGNLTEGTTEWSETAIFTTETLILELADNATDNGEVVETYDGVTANNVKLEGRTLYKDGKWNTICLPFNVDLAGSVLDGAIARALTDAGITQSGENTATLSLTFGETVSTLVAGTPYIIRWTEGDDIEDPVFENVTIDKTDRSFVSGSGDTRVKFLGNYDAQSFSDADNGSVLLVGGNNKLRYANAKAHLGACRAYFQIGEDGNAVRLNGFSIDFGDETTGIVSLNSASGFTPDSSSNGEDNDWYTLDGRKLNGKPTTKGVYINKSNSRKYTNKD